MDDCGRSTSRAAHDKITGPARLRGRISRSAARVAEREAQWNRLQAAQFPQRQLPGAALQGQGGPSRRPGRGSWTDIVRRAGRPTGKKPPGRNYPPVPRPAGRRCTTGAVERTATRWSPTSRTGSAESCVGKPKISAAKVKAHNLLDSVGARVTVNSTCWV
jgi:hypothetical protein